MKISYFTVDREEIRQVKFNKIIYRCLKIFMFAFIFLGLIYVSIASSNIYLQKHNFAFTQYADQAAPAGLVISFNSSRLGATANITQINITKYHLSTGTKCYIYPNATTYASHNNYIYSASFVGNVCSITGNFTKDIPYIVANDKDSSSNFRGYYSSGSDSYPVHDTKITWWEGVLSNGVPPNGGTWTHFQYYWDIVNISIAVTTYDIVDNQTLTPTGFNYTTLNNQSFLLYWNNQSAVKYEIDHQGFSDDVNTTNTSYVWYLYSNNTGTNFLIRAYDTRYTIPWSNWTSVLTAYTGQNTPPSPPINQTPTPTNLSAELITNNSYRISWDSQSGSIFYLYDNQSNIYNTTENFIDFNDIGNNTRITYWLQSYNLAYVINLSNYTSNISVTTLQNEAPVVGNYELLAVIEEQKQILENIYEVLYMIGFAMMFLGLIYLAFKWYVAGNAMMGVSMMAFNAMINGIQILREGGDSPYILFYVAMIAFSIFAALRLQVVNVDKA